MKEASSVRAEQNSDIRELRLGLVCYGGVSLAIYMHGITKEIQKLVVASRAFESDPDNNRFSPASSEHVYWQALRKARDRQGVTTRVVVDVVAGTSAGGINGIFLCKALAHNLSQAALRDLWFQRADIQQLLGPGRIKKWLKLFKFARTLPFNKAEPPLNGAAMLGWLRDALCDMDRGRPKGAQETTLMPEGHKLQLFVTTTDYHGYRQYLTINDPPSVTERRNRHILNFCYESSKSPRDQFGPEHNAALAFAARATSSFPGAFPPLRIADAIGGGELSDFQKELFRAYQLSGADAGKTYFMDGGVLNNYPFRPAIEAITKLRAESQVDRFLLYLQPDPGEEAKNPDGEGTSFFGAVWAGLSGIASSQPIADELVAARKFNERVRRVENLVAQSEESVLAMLAGSFGDQPLGATLENISQEDLAAMRVKLDGEARRHGGYLYEPYFQIRVQSVVEQFAAAICTLCEYETAENNIAFLIRQIINRWADSRGFVGRDADRIKQEELLRDFDLGYTRRRFAFVLQLVNSFYGQADGAGPSRVSLNKAKAALYDGIDALNGLIRGHSLANEVQKILIEIFPLETLLSSVTEARPLVEVAERFVEEHGAKLDDIYKQLGGLLLDSKKAVHKELFKDFLDVTADWTKEQRGRLLSRYFGFPFWDAMIYPITRLSEAGELRPLHIVRLSPLDSRRLSGLNGGGNEKLEGRKHAHFGGFLRREWRENDYLWGRLDAAERLLALVLRDPADPSKLHPVPDGELKPLFAAILAEEESEKALPHISPLLKKLKSQVAAMR